MLASALQRRSPRRGFRCAAAPAACEKAILSIVFRPLVLGGGRGGISEDAEKLFRTGQYDECSKAVDARNRERRLE